MSDKPSWWDRLRKRDAASAEALSLPPMSRGMQLFSMLLFFGLGVGLTALVLLNPLQVSSMLGSEDPAETIYMCPMHPEVVQHEPGSCPICGMDLELQGGSESGGAHDHDHGEVASHGIYACPMNCSDLLQDEPGSCPVCGMDLELQGTASAAPADGDVIRIDPVRVQNTGVVSVPAVRTDIPRTSRTVGMLDYDAEAVTWINVKYEGWIEKVHVTYLGQEVRQRAALFEIYSPELVTTQQEYLRALAYRDSMRESNDPISLRRAESLLSATRSRLAYWDISSDQIDALEASGEAQRRLVVQAPVDGVVAEVMSETLEGMYVKPGMNLYKLVDLSSVWVHVDVYEEDMRWVRPGQTAEVTFQAEPERRYRGKILFLYPEVSSQTRTLKICVEVRNPARRLRPGMYADVVLSGPTLRDAVAVPESAVIRSGERSLVFVDLGEGRFDPREVELGVRGEEDRVQVQRGVEAGERVVTRAQFMLDSESRLQQAIAAFRDRAAGDGGEAGGGGGTP